MILPKGGRGAGVKQRPFGIFFQVYFPNSKNTAHCFLAFDAVGEGVLPNKDTRHRGGVACFPTQTQDAFIGILRQRPANQ